MILPIINLKNKNELYEIAYAKKSSKAKYGINVDTGDSAKPISKASAKTTVSNTAKSNKSESVKNTTDTKSSTLKTTTSTSTNTESNNTKATVLASTTPAVANTRTSTLKVDSAQLSTVPTTLKAKSEDILKVYNNNVKNILETSKEAIAVSGLNFETFESYFASAFTSLSNELENLANVLQNQILPKYDNLSISIRNVFNNEFGSQMQSIIEELKK